MINFEASRINEWAGESRRRRKGSVSVSERVINERHETTTRETGRP